MWKNSKESLGDFSVFVREAMKSNMSMNEIFQRSEAFESDFKRDIALVKPQDMRLKGSETLGKIL